VYKILRLPPFVAVGVKIPIPKDRKRFHAFTSARQNRDIVSG
jgi:hypothetical protein